MRRILTGTAVMLAAAAAIAFALGVTSASAGDPSYKVELDNAFGLVQGEQFKVAGVPAGTISTVDLCSTDKTAHCQSPTHALVTVQVTQGGFGSFHQDATCESRPQSLIGEYFLSCDPGHTGRTLAPGATIPITHTHSTIPADLLADVMRLPYRQRLALILNELGAGVAGNAQNLQAALQRAVPALTETDNLLTALKSTFHDLPGFLEQLRPTLQKLGAAATANTPAVTNLNSSATQIDRLISDLPPFANSARPALASLGQASVTGKAAVIAANPTVKLLNKFAKPTPELAQNLAIVLHDLDNRSRAVEKDPRSPGGQGYTGLESVLQYVFNQVLAVDYFTPFGHTLALDLEINTQCTPYATPATIAQNLKLNGTSYRQCYNWLGPNQPGVNETDPSNPGACVPDPGGAPPGKPGPTTSACRVSLATRASGKSAHQSKHAQTTSSPATSSGSASGGSSGSSGGLAGVNLKQTVSSIVGALTGAVSKPKPAPQPTPSSSSTSGSSSSGSSSSGSGGNAVQNLLSYLLSP